MQSLPPAYSMPRQALYVLNGGASSADRYMITLPAFKESFAALVAAPTVSSIDPRYDQGNLPVVDLLANWFADLGFAVETMPVNGREDKVNLIASLGMGTGGLVLSGHTDTVPFTESAWYQDPFELTEKDGRFYGLGTSDTVSYTHLTLPTKRIV